MALFVILCFKSEYTFVDMAEKAKYRFARIQEIKGVVVYEGYHFYLNKSYADTM